MNGLLNDIIFKIVFGSQQNERCLLSLINALLGLSGPEEILELTIRNPTLDKVYAIQRNAILDIRALDGLGQHYNVEIQVRPETDYIHRSLFYLSRMYGQQLESGDDYAALRRCVGISILDFHLFDHTPDLHSTFHFYDVVHQHRLTNFLEIHYIELSKFQQKLPNELKSQFEKWLYLLKFGERFRLDDEPIPKELQEEEGIVMAIDSMRKAYATDEVKEMLEMRLKAQWDYNSRLASDLAEARAEGEAKGKAEERLELAKKLKARGIDAASILELTGVDPAQL